MPASRRPFLRLGRPSPQAARSAITDTAVVTSRKSASLHLQPDLLVFSTIQPVMFVLLFVYVFGSAIGRSLPQGVAYVDFLLPGIFVQSVTFGASQAAIGLKEDLTRAVVDRFRAVTALAASFHEYHLVAWVLGTHRSGPWRCTRRSDVLSSR